MSDLQENDDLLNFDIGDADYGDEQLNEDELLLSDEEEFLGTNESNIDDELLDSSDILLKNDASLENKDLAKKVASSTKKGKEVGQKQLPQQNPVQITRKRLKRKNPSIILPLDSKTEATAKKTKIQIKRGSESTIPEVASAKKVIDANKILEVKKILESQQKSPEKLSRPKRIRQEEAIGTRVLRDLKVRGAANRSKLEASEHKILRKHEAPELEGLTKLEARETKILAKHEAPELKDPAKHEAPELKDPIKLEAPELKDPAKPEAPGLEDPAKPEAPGLEDPAKPEAPGLEDPAKPEATELEDPAKPEATELEGPTKREEISQKPQGDESFGEDFDILELDVPGQVDRDYTEAPGIGDAEKRNFTKKPFRAGLGYGGSRNYQQQSQGGSGPMEAQWRPGPGPGPGSNFSGQQIPPTFPGGPIRPSMGQNPPPHLVGNRMPGVHPSQLGPIMPNGPPGMGPRHPMGPRMQMQGPPGHMIGNFPSGPRGGPGPGPFFNNYMVGPGPGPRHVGPGPPPNMQQRFFYQNQNQMPPGMRPQIGPNAPPNKSPMKNPQLPIEAGGSPEYMRSGPGQFHGDMSHMARKVLINPNFKGGVEAAKNQLIKDQFGIPYMSGPPLSDDELLRQQQEFINKNLRCVEKRRYERSPSPNYRHYSDSPSPPPYRNSYQGGRRNSGDRQHYNKNRGGSPKYRSNDDGNRDKDENPVEEDEETRAYRLQIEKQKKQREEMLRQKEMRRRQAAEQKAKEIQEKDEPTRLQPIVVTDKKIILNKNPKLKDKLQPEEQQENTLTITKSSAKVDKILAKKFVTEFMQKSSTPSPPIPLQTHKETSESYTPPLPQVQTNSRRIVLKPSAELKKKTSLSNRQSATIFKRLEGGGAIPNKIITDVSKRKMQNIVKTNSIE